VGLGKGFVPNPLEPVAVLAVIGAAGAASAKQDGWAFGAAAVGMAATVGSIFAELYPHVMVSTTNSAYTLTVANTTSPSYTLHVMTIVAVIFFPVVLLYQGWSYHVFRGRLSAPRVGAEPSAPTSPGDSPGAAPPAAVSSPTVSAEGGVAPERDSLPDHD